MAGRKCVGCDGDLTGATREHVLAQWLAEEIKILGVGLEHYQHDGEKGNDVLLRSHGLNNLAVRNVCRACNKGWMSRLEGVAKPSILGLMNLKTGILQLPMSERTTLARWAIKTAFMIASVQQARLELPWHLFRQIRDDDPKGPDGCSVLAAQLPFLPGGFLYACPTDGAPGESPVQVRVGFSIRYLHFVTVIPLIEAPRVLRVAAGIHFPLWPLDLEVLGRWVHVPTITSSGELISFLTNLVEAGIVFTEQPAALRANPPLEGP